MSVGDCCQLSEAQLRQLAVDAPREARTTYTYQRPRTTSFSHETLYYMLKETEGSQTYGAFGVRIEAAAVTFSIAFVDLFSCFPEDQADQFVANAASIIMDYAGTAMQDTCKAGANCRRRPGCTFAHPGVPKIHFSRLARVCPKSVKDQNPGMSDEVPTYAIVLDITYPRTPDGQSVDWAATPTVHPMRSQAIVCESSMLDNKVDKKARSGAVDLSGSTSANLALLARFSEVQTFGPSSTATFADLCGDVIDVENVPDIDFVKGKPPGIKRSTRRFLGVRRLIIDVCCDVFNAEAVKFLRTRAPQAPLIARSWTLPRDVAAAVGVGTTSRNLTMSSRAPNANVPLSSILKLLPWDFALQTADEVASQPFMSAAGRTIDVKFNAPFRDWQSTVNMRVLHSAISQPHAPMPRPPSQQQVQNAQDVVTRRGHQEALKVSYAMDAFGLQAVAGACVVTDDGKSQFLFGPTKGHLVLMPIDEDPTAPKIPRACTMGLRS